MQQGILTSRPIRRTTRGSRGTRRKGADTSVKSSNADAARPSGLCTHGAFSQLRQRDTTVFSQTTAILRSGPDTSAELLLVYPVT